MSDGEDNMMDDEDYEFDYEDSDQDQDDGQVDMENEYYTAKGAPTAAKPWPYFDREHHRSATYLTFINTKFKTSN